MTYPTITPKLTLDFANSRQLDPRITFSRSSTATYLHPDTGLITTAPSGVARFEKEGFLIEEARTNLHAYSEEFDNAAWVKANVSITANSTTAPDGTSTADTLNCSSGGQTFQHIRKSATTTAASYTFSCFVKAGNISTIRLGGESYTKYATFSLTGDGSYSSVTAGASASIVLLSNGWYRCTLTYTASSGTYVNDIRFSSAALNDYVYIWGAQLEQGSFSTSYIPTTSSTVTRASDVASITGTNFSGWYGGLSGTFAHESLNNSNAASIPLVCDDGTNANRILFNNSGSYQLQIRVSGATIVQMDANPGTAPSGMTKYAGSYEVGNASVSFDGVSATTTASDIPQCSRLQISQFSGNSKFNTISRISYYDRRVSDATLETLTS